MSAVGRRLLPATLERFERRERPIRLVRAASSRNGATPWGQPMSTAMIA